MGRATIENVSQGSFVQQSRDEDSEESEENDSEESEQYYTATFEAKVRA